MDNSKILENLYLVLNEERKIYEQILNLANSKTKIIVEGKVKELEEMMKIEQDAINRMRKLEELREKLAAAIVNNLGINADKLNIEDILDKIDKCEIREKLKDLKNNILKIINELKNVNEINAKLIQNSLDYIDFSVNLISNVDNGSNNYGNKGLVNDAKKKSYFDRRF